MDSPRSDGQALSSNSHSSTFSSRFELIAGSFLELFQLLEQYAPAWYTEGHHDRALLAQAALRTWHEDSEAEKLEHPSVPAIPTAARAAKNQA